MVRGGGEEVVKRQKKGKFHDFLHADDGAFSYHTMKRAVRRNMGMNERQPGDD